MQWDLRTLGGGPGASSQPVAAWLVDGKPVIRVALCQGAPCGAAATTHGLFTLDVGGAALAGAHGAKPPDQRAVSLPGEAQRAPGKYHSAVWDPQQGVLQAGWTSAASSAGPYRLLEERERRKRRDRVCQVSVNARLQQHRGSVTGCRRARRPRPPAWARGAPPHSTRLLAEN